MDCNCNSNTPVVGLGFLQGPGASLKRFRLPAGSLNPVQSVTVTVRYSYSPLQLQSVTVTVRYSYRPLQLQSVTVTSDLYVRYSYSSVLSYSYSSILGYSYSFRKVTVTVSWGLFLLHFSLIIIL